jgi:hypothetical protein
MVAVAQVGARGLREDGSSSQCGAMVRVRYQSTSKPFSASRIAGAHDVGQVHGAEPLQREQSPATEPGIATDFGPTLLASPTTRRHGNRACATPSPSS